MTPSQLLRKMARENREMAAKLRERAEKHDKWAAENDRQAEEMEAATGEVLTEAVRPVKTTGTSMMEKSQRVNISRAKRRKGDKISAGINKADLSKNALAAKLGVTPAALSRWISGDRRIPQSRAEEIAAATKGNVPVSAWPNLSTDDA